MPGGAGRGAGGRGVKKAIYTGLRRIAEMETVGQPVVAYRTDRNGCRVLDPRSTRGMYQWMKRRVSK